MLVIAKVSPRVRSPSGPVSPSHCPGREGAISLPAASLQDMRTCMTLFHDCLSPSFGCFEACDVSRTTENALHSIAHHPGLMHAIASFVFKTKTTADKQFFSPQNATVWHL